MAASNGSAGLRLCNCWRGGEAILIDGEARKPGKKRERCVQDRVFRTCPAISAHLAAKKHPACIWRRDRFAKPLAVSPRDQLTLLDRRGRAMQACAKGRAQQRHAWHAQAMGVIRSPKS
jgi:hypothetical protein